MKAGFVGAIRRLMSVRIGRLARECVQALERLAHLKLPLELEEKRDLFERG